MDKDAMEKWRTSKPNLCGQEVHQTEKGRVVLSHDAIQTAICRETRI